MTKDQTHTIICDTLSALEAAQERVKSAAFNIAETDKYAMIECMRNYLSLQRMIDRLSRRLI